MKRTRLLDGVLWGVSALIGLAVAEGVYKASKNTIEKRELIGDGDYDIELFEDEGDGFINFRGIGNGVDYGVSLNRTFYTNLYTE